MHVRESMKRNGARLNIWNDPLDSKLFIIKTELKKLKKKET